MFLWWWIIFYESSRAEHWVRPHGDCSSLWWKYCLPMQSTEGNTDVQYAEKRQLTQTHRYLLSCLPTHYFCMYLPTLYNSCTVLLVLYFMPDSAFSSYRDLRSSNITVNLWVVNERWLFSLLWCAGASSVTTNACHLLKDVEQPDWVMVSNTYSLRHLVACALFHLPAIKSIST